MIQYKAWTPRLLNELALDYNAGKIPTIYLELSAKCTLCSCLYCDSKVGKPHTKELTYDEIEKLILKLKTFFPKLINFSFAKITGKVFRFA